jgi:predicted dienelactone hydrolase
MKRWMILISLMVVAWTAGVQANDGYDPMKIDVSAPAEFLDAVVTDTKRSREIPIRIYQPSSSARNASTPTPCILFSHGLGGARTNNGYLGNHLASRGYTVIFLQHAGSDEEVWRDVPVRDRMKKLQDAASPQNLMLRCDDVRFVLDQVEAWQRQPGHALYGKVNVERIGMSGHSFGAVTTQATSGQSFPIFGQRYTDKRIDAAIAYSCSVPQRGSAEKMFANVEVPWMLMTGTLDSAPIGGQTPESRLNVFPNLSKKISRYELVLFEAEHSAFGERALPGENGKRNPNHHRAILALSTAFWDTYLKEDPAAKQWLNSDQVRSVLEQQDRWQIGLPQR